MAGFVVSTVLHQLEQLSPDIPGLQVHGANLIISRIFGHLLTSPEVEALEVFLSPAEYQRREQMANIAFRLLPKERRGKGVLTFYPIHFLPDIWQDARPRILLTLDPELLPRDRYLRDCFAIGPTPISCQTHGLGDPNVYAALARVAQGSHVPFDIMTCLSAACRASFEQMFAVLGHGTPCGLHVMPNPVDTGTFFPRDKMQKHGLRKLLSLPDDGTITLYMGRLTPNSKADLLPLIRTFAEVSGPTDSLVIAGQENTSGYVERLAAEGASTGLGERLQVRTGIEPWAASLYYGAADLLVFPSDNVQECLANTVLEAMSSGLPTLVSDWDGLRDSVVDGITGYLVPTTMMCGLERVEAMSPAVPILSNMLLSSQSVWVDTRVLKDRLQSLLRSPETLLKMGAAGRSRIEANYTWKSIGSRLFALWSTQLELAANEDKPNAAARRASGGRMGLPMNYRSFFGGHATHLVTLTDEIRLTPRGLSLLEGGLSLKFYDECLSVVRPEMVTAAFETLWKTKGDWVSLGLAAEAAADTAGVSVDLALFHFGLFLKQDAIELRVEKPHKVAT